MSFNSRYKLNEELEQKLRSNYAKETLVRLFRIFSGEESDATKKRLAENLAGPFREQTEDFFNDLEQLRDTRLSKNRAKEFLEEKCDISRDRFDDVDENLNLNLLLLIYELMNEGEMERSDFNRLMRYSKVFLEKSNEVFYTDEVLDLDNLEHRLKSFISDNNSEDYRAMGFDLQTRDNGEVIIDLYREYGRRARPTFDFRNDGTESIPDDPDVEYESAYPLKTISFKISHLNEETKIAFSGDPYDGWQGILGELFAEVFGVPDVPDSLRKKSSPVVSEIQQTAKNAAEEGEDAVKEVKETIDERTEEVAEAIEENDRSDADTEEVKKRLNSVELAGYIISDDPKTRTSRFEVISNDFSGLLRTVDRMDESLESYLKEADPDNIEPVIQIENEMVRLRDGGWGPLHGKMSESNMELVELLIEEIDE